MLSKFCSKANKTFTTASAAQVCMKDVRRSNSFNFPCLTFELYLCYDVHDPELTDIIIKPTRI